MSAVPKGVLRYKSHTQHHGWGFHSRHGFQALHELPEPTCHDDGLNSRLELAARVEEFHAVKVLAHVVALQFRRVDLYKRVPSPATPYGHQATTS